MQNHCCAQKMPASYKTHELMISTVELFLKVIRFCRKTSCRTLSRCLRSQIVLVFFPLRIVYGCCWYLSAVNAFRSTFGKEDGTSRPTHSADHRGRVRRAPFADTSKRRSLIIFIRSTPRAAGSALLLPLVRTFPVPPVRCRGVVALNVKIRW